MSRDKDRLPEGDDGRTIASMNVDGMPWYNRGRERQGERLGDRQGARQGERGAGQPQGGEPLSGRDRRVYMLAAVLTGLAVVAVFAAAAFLFIAFCDFVWFGNKL